MNELNALEIQVLDFIVSILEGNSDEVKQQLQLIKSIKREYTGVGFFTTFTLSEAAKDFQTTPLRLIISNVQGEVEGLKRGAGFILFFNEGLIETLEGFTYSEDWPDDAKLVRISTIKESN